MSDLYRVDSHFPRKRLKLTLPIPPSVNHMYINLGRGGKKLTHQAQSYFRRTRIAIERAMSEQRWDEKEDRVWYYIDIVVFMPDRKIRDSHNMLKILLDSMEGMIFDNDYYALPRIQTVEYDRDNPRLEILIHPQSASGRSKALSICT